MLDFYNLPLEFWGSLEFVCILFGLFPLVLIQVVALGLISVDIVRESRWYKNRWIRTVYVQTDEDTELMEYYASGASPLDLLPESSSSTGSTTPPYPSTLSSTYTSDPAPSTSSQSTSPDPSPSTPGESPSASPESNQAPEPSTSPSQTTQLSTLQEIIIEQQASESGVSQASQASDSIDGWSNLNGVSSPPPPPPPPPPKITSMLLKNTSSGKLTKGKTSSYHKSPMRKTLSSNSNSYKGVSNTFSKNPFATYERTAAAAARDKSDDVKMFDFSSGTYCKSPFALWDDFSSSENAVEESAITSEKTFRKGGSTETAFDHVKNGMSSSPDSICKIINDADCKSSVRSSRESSSLKSSSSDQYMSEVYMGIV